MYPYLDQNRTIRERVEDLLQRMSIQEKVGQVNQHLYGWQCYTKKGDTIELTEQFKKHVEWGGGLGALYGLFRADPWSKVTFDNGILERDSRKVANQIQAYVQSHSRWHIPALFIEECPHGHLGLESISYPTNIGKGNSFNVSLMEKVAQYCAMELTNKGVHLALVSTLDLMKDPRWGRSEECFSEDPIVSAKMTEAIISGFQGTMIDDRNFLDKKVSEVKKQSHHMGVVLKHCIGQGEALGGHNAGTVPIGHREFLDIYTSLLQSTKNAMGIMAAYNDIDGVPCHSHPTLFEELLRKQYGFQGITMADGLALDRLDTLYPSAFKRADKALQAGIDLSLWDETYTKIEPGITSGKIKESSLDRSVRRVLAIKFLLGLFDHPMIQESEWHWKEDAKNINLKVAKESITLLKNKGVLPIHKAVDKIAVIGPNANTIYHMLGDYTPFQTKEQQSKTIYQYLQKKLPTTKVVYAKGCEVRKQTNQEEFIKEAIKIASTSDIIIAVLGGSSAREFDIDFLANGAVSSKTENMDCGENVDVASLQLGGKQEFLLQQLSKLKKPIITILIQGRPYDLTTVERVSDAMLVAWYPGQEGGHAIVETLLGNYNPSGRLSITYPRSSNQLPMYYYQREVPKQEHYFDMSGKPLYPFGYGLSYTTFVYTNLLCTAFKDKIEVKVTVKNTGKTPGQISTLLFVKLFGGSIIQRTKLLKDFRKDTLQQEEQKTLLFTLHSEDFYYVDVDNQFHCANKAKIMIEDLSIDVILADDISIE